MLVMPHVWETIRALAPPKAILIQPAGKRSLCWSKLLTTKQDPACAVWEGFSVEARLVMQIIKLKWESLRTTRSARSQSTAAEVCSV
jgi:hypothetical protein